MLGERLSDAHLALAIAHADCIPSIRLQYSKATADVKLYSCLPHWLDRWVAEEPISQSRGTAANENPFERPGINELLNS